MGWCGAGRRPRGAARGARRPWWRTCGPAVGPARAPAGRSNTATAATRRDHVRPAITAGQRPRPDFWHPTGSMGRPEKWGLCAGSGAHRCTPWRRSPSSSGPTRMSYTVTGLPVRDYRCTIALTPTGDAEGARRRARPTSPPTTRYWRSRPSLISSAARVGSRRGPTGSSSCRSRRNSAGTSGDVLPLHSTRQSWDRLPDRFGLQPEEHAFHSDLMAAVRRAIEEDLTERQRQVFIAIAINGIRSMRWRTGSSRTATRSTRRCSMRGVDCELCWPLMDI